VLKVVFNRWWSYGVHGERGACVYSEGLGAEPPIGSRSKDPGRGSGSEALWSWWHFSIWR